MSKLIKQFSQVQENYPQKTKNMRRIFHRNAIDYVLTFARFAHFRQANAGKRPNCPNKSRLFLYSPGKVKGNGGGFAQK